MTAPETEVKGRDEPAAVAAAPQGVDGRSRVNPRGTTGARRTCGARLATTGSGSDERGFRGHSDRPDLSRLPARREPQHADARRWSAAVQEAGRRRAQLRPRDVRGDARRRGDRPAVPQAAAPLDQDRRPARLGARRAVRHRAPRAAQRAAQARPGPRAARPLLAAAQHPAGLGAPALGGARHRGHARRPGRDVHQDPSRPGRRRLRDAAGAERAQHRPRPARHAGAVGSGRHRPLEEAHRRPRAQPLRRTGLGDPQRPRHHRRGRRPARAR